MGYIKARHVLPDELVVLIQEYIDGEYVYIPRKKGNEKGWGECNGAKTDLKIRNRQIFERCSSGISISMLAEEYFLSEGTIRKIVSIEKRKMKGT